MERDVADPSASTNSDEDFRVPRRALGGSLFACSGRGARPGLVPGRAARRIRHLSLSGRRPRRRATKDAARPSIQPASRPRWRMPGPRTVPAEPILRAATAPHACASPVDGRYQP